jgi:hypothetical protein
VYFVALRLVIYVACFHDTDALHMPAVFSKNLRWGSSKTNSITCTTIWLEKRRAVPSQAHTNGILP